MTITDYKIVKDIDEERFEKTINNMITSGWQPYGDLIIIQKQGDEICDGLFQVMVKRDDES